MPKTLYLCYFGLREPLVQTQVIPYLQVGNLCIILDDSLPPLEWRLGKIIEAHNGENGHVRVFILQTQGDYDENGEREIRIFKKPISNIAHSLLASS